jgi:hypothetical protein
MAEMISKPRRPFVISLLSLVFLALSLAGFTRLVLTLVNAGLLDELNARPGVAYLAADGALWGLAGLPVAYGLWTGRRWAPRAAIVAGMVIIFTFWLDRFIAASNSGTPPNNAFALAVTLLGMGFLYWAVTTPRSRAFFQIHPSKNQLDQPPGK